MATAPSITSSDPKTLLAVPRIRRWLELMVEGKAFRDAATEAGIRQARARAFMRDPQIKRAISKEIETIRSTNQIRNLRAAETMRDAAFNPTSTAAERKVALEAARYLDGGDLDGRSGINIHGSVTIAGYVINLEGPASGSDPVASAGVTSRHPETGAKPLIDLDAVTDVSE
jgi:hypothetical protein